MATPRGKRSLTRARKTDGLTRAIQTLVTEDAGDKLEKAAADHGMKLAAYLRVIVYRSLGLIDTPKAD